MITRVITCSGAYGNHGSGLLKYVGFLICVEYHTLQHFVMCSDNKSSMHRVGAGRNRFSVLKS